MDFYNNERLHTAIGYITPTEMNKKCMEEFQKARNLMGQYCLQLGDLSRRSILKKDTDAYGHELWDYYTGSKFSAHEIKVKTHYTTLLFRLPLQRFCHHLIEDITPRFNGKSAGIAGKEYKTIYRL